MRAFLWEYIKELLADTFGLAFALWTIFCFHQILTVGWVKFIEPNSLAAWAELITAIAFGVLMLERIYKDIWKVKIKRRSR